MCYRELLSFYPLLIYVGSYGATTQLGSPNAELGQAGAFDFRTLTKSGKGY